MELFVVIIVILLLSVALPLVLIYQGICQKDSRHSTSSTTSSPSRQYSIVTQKYSSDEYDTADWDNASEEYDSIEARRLERVDSFHDDIFSVVADDAHIQSIWDCYSRSLHDESGQFYRQKRALYNTIPISINTQEMSALFLSSSLTVDDEADDIVYQTSLTQCSCPDFKKRGGPCKHIYRLFFELTHLPYGNPQIVDIDPFITDGLFALTLKARENLLVGVYQNGSFSRCSRKTKLIKEQISVGFLEESSDIPYESLLNAMTKEQIFSALEEKEVQGYRKGWRKSDLVSWILDSQPGFLKKQFRGYVLLSFNPILREWIDGIQFAKKSFFNYEPANILPYSNNDSDFQSQSVTSDSSVPHGTKPAAKEDTVFQILCPSCGKELWDFIITCPFCGAHTFSVSLNRWSNDIHYSSESLWQLDASKAPYMLPAKISGETAVFTNTRGDTYRTTLSRCDCSFSVGRNVPCRHIYRLADELGRIKKPSTVPGSEVGFLECAVGEIENMPESAQLLLKKYCEDLNIPATAPSHVRMRPVTNDLQFLLDYGFLIDAAVDCESMRDFMLHDKYRQALLALRKKDLVPLLASHNISFPDLKLSELRAWCLGDTAVLHKMFRPVSINYIFKKDGNRRFYSYLQSKFDGVPSDDTEIIKFLEIYKSSAPKSPLE